MVGTDQPGKLPSRFRTGAVPHVYDAPMAGLVRA